MSKFVRHFFRSQRSVAFTLTTLCLAAVVLSSASAFAKTNNNAYVPNNNGTLSVIDTRTDTVIATIPGGFNHPFCASSPRSSK